MKDRPDDPSHYERTLYHRATSHFGGVQKSIEADHIISYWKNKRVLCYRTPMSDTSTSNKSTKENRNGLLNYETDDNQFISADNETFRMVAHRTFKHSENFVRSIHLRFNVHI